MRFHKFQSKPISVLLSVILIFLYLPLAFSKASDGLTFKVICEKNMGLPCPKSNKSKKNYLTFSRSDIQCISGTSTVNKEKNIIIHNVVIHKDNPTSIFNNILSYKNDTFIKNPNYNKKMYSLNFVLTESAGSKLFQLTSDNLGRPMQVIYNNKVMTTAIVLSPLTANFYIASIPENIFKHLKQKLNLQECPASKM